MKVKHLRKGIIYEGSGIIGGNSKVILTPTDNPGWLWDTGGNTVPISPEMVRPKFRHISLESGDSGTIGYIEHLLPIRYFGIDEVMLWSDPMPPYDGCMKGLLETVATQTEESDLEIPWKTLTNNIYCEGVGKGGRQRKLNVFSRDKQGVAITVIIDFPGLGHYNQTFELPDDNLFKMVCSAKTLGWPLWLEPLSRWTPKCLWPHHDKIHWPNQSNTEEALRIIAFHRALDILGVLAAVGAGSGFLLAVDVISICAGHRLDTEMLRQIKEEDLRPVTVG